LSDELKIDEEFKKYLIPLSDDEYKQLEENLKKGWERERGMIIVWEGVIVDGHNRYEICKKYNIPFEMHERKFKDRDDALLFIINNQNGRRNQPDYAQIKLNLKKVELELKQKAKEKQLSGLVQFQDKENTVFQISEKREIAQNQQQEHEKKPLSAMPEKSVSEETNASVGIQKSEKPLSTVDASPEIQPEEDKKVIQSSENLSQQDHQQEPDKEQPSFDEKVPFPGAINSNVAFQKSEKQDLGKPDTVTQKPENLPLKTEEKPINITKRVAEKTKTSVDTVSKVKFISEKADAETEKRLMKGDKDLSINKVYRDLKKAEKRKEILQSFKEPELPKKKKKYSIIYADPPWAFENYSDKGKGRSPENHYKCLSLQDIKNLAVNELAANNCVLFIWVTFPFLEKGFEVIKAWGFKYKTVGYVWVKRNKKSDGWFWGLGYWTRSNAEVCLIATKGNITRQSNSVHQIIDSPVEGHSKKPDIVREKIVELCGDIPRIELFARQKTDGWEVWGNEVELKIKRR